MESRYAANSGEQQASSSYWDEREARKWKPISVEEGVKDISLVGELKKILAVQDDSPHWEVRDRDRVIRDIKDDSKDGNIYNPVTREKFRIPEPDKILEHLRNLSNKITPENVFNIINTYKFYKDYTTTLVKLKEYLLDKGVIKNADNQTNFRYNTENTLPTKMFTKIFEGLLIPYYIEQQQDAASGGGRRRKKRTNKRKRLNKRRRSNKRYK